MQTQPWTESKLALHPGLSKCTMTHHCLLPPPTSSWTTSLQRLALLHLPNTHQNYPLLLSLSLSLKTTPPLSSLPKPTKSPILSPKLSAHHHHTLPQIPPLPLFPQLFPPTPLSPSSPNLYTPKQTSSVHFPSSQILTWLNSS